MDDLIEQFCSITGADKDSAQRFITLADSNLQMAVELFFLDSSNDYSKPTTSTSTSDVRSPIPQQSALLVNESFQSSYAPKRLKSTNSVFDKFRDFQAETAEQTKLIKEAATNSGTNNGSTSSVEKSTEMPSNTLAKRRTLESLFRPPLELMFRGTFEAAKQEAVQKKLWLLVNVQNVGEFACQALNRDIWNNPMVKSMISQNFIFWQIYFDSADGNRFCTYYPVDKHPFVAAIDPLTGELIKPFRVLCDAVAFCDSIVSFLESHLNPFNTATSTESALQKNAEKVLSKRKLTDSVEHEEHEPGPSSKSVKFVKLPDHPQCNGFLSNAADAPASQNETYLNWRDFIATTGDEVQLMFRLPDGKKYGLTLKADSKLKAVLLYGHTELSLPTSDYNYVLNHPRRVLNDFDMELNLHSAGMSRQEIIYVERR